MVRKNEWGKKVIGAALSMAMGFTAVPAMASLAAERDFSSYYSSYKHAYAAGPLERVTLGELSLSYSQALDFYNQYQSKIPGGIQNRCIEVFNYVSGVIDNEDSRPDNYAIANNDLADVCRTMQFFAESEYPTPEGPQFISGEEEPVAPDYGMDLDEEDDNFQIEHQDDFSITPDFQIDHQDDFTIEGEPTPTPVEDEFVAPDYGIDMDAWTQTEESSDEDEFCAPDYGIDMDAWTQTEESSDETPVIDEIPSAEEETTASDTEAEESTSNQPIVVVIVVDNGSNDETAETTPAPAAETSAVNEAPATQSAPAVESAPATVSAPSASSSSAPAASAAPATQVLGATRDRASLANDIVERLYVNALNRPSDTKGKAYWVNMILEDSDNLDIVVSGFLTSAEFNARNRSDDEFVTVLYRVMFNRTPSASERK